MYAMRPVVDREVAIDPPTSMYRMRSVHSGRNGEVINDTGHVGITKQPSEMMEVMRRQEDILRQLSELRDQMISLRETLRADTKSTPSSTSIKEWNINIESYSAVINVSPTQPPFFLEVVQNVLRNVVNLRIQTHLHSTVPVMPKIVKECAERLEKNSNCDQNSLPSVEARVIVKNVDTQAQLSIGSDLIIGEVNILRFLARTIPCLRYENANVYEIDSILDLCYMIAETKTKSGRGKLIQTIYKKLGKSRWLCNEEEFTIADIAVYTTLKHLDENELNVTLMKYLQNCKSTFEL